MISSGAHLQNLYKERTCIFQTNFSAEGPLVTAGERLEDLPDSSREKHNRVSVALLALP